MDVDMDIDLGDFDPEEAEMVNSEAENVHHVFNFIACVITMTDQCTAFKE